MTKNLNLDLILARFAQKFFAGVLPLLDITHCCKLSLYAISRKTNKSNLRKWKKKKNSFRPDFGSSIQSWENLVTRQIDESLCLSVSLYDVERFRTRNTLPCLSLSEQKIRRMCYKQQYIYETNSPTKLPWCLIRAPEIAKRYNNCYPNSQALRIKKIYSLEQQFFCPTKKMDQSISKTWL